MLALVITTWNCDDLVESFLRFHLHTLQPVIYAMDFGSTDGTTEMLERFRREGLIRTVPFPGLAKTDPSNLMLDRVRADGECDWALFIDPDEFVADPAALLRAVDEAPDDTWALQFQRFNVTGVRPDDPRGAAPLPFEQLDLRVARPAFRDGIRCIPVDDLQPPWIHSFIGPKIVVRVASEARVGDGDHELRGGRVEPVDAPILLHFPFRSWRHFLDKVTNAERDMAANPQRPEIFGWHQRRWIRQLRQGDLFAEYCRQFVDPAEREGLIAEGQLEPLSAELVTSFRRAMLAPVGT